MEWLTFIWLAAMIPCALIGQGVLMFLIVRLVYKKWFEAPDIRDTQIVLLREQLAESIIDRNRLIVEKEVLVGKCIDLAKTAV